MSQRPNIAVIAHVQAPYRSHVHRRIAREMQEVQLHTAYLREQNDQAWTHVPDPQTNPVIFGYGQGVERYSPVLESARDFVKGGRVIRWMEERDIRAVVMGGYADAARVRAILWCHRRHIPCFLTGDSNIRADLVTGRRRTVKKAFVPWIARRLDMIMPFGRRGHEYYRRYGVPESKLAYFPYEPDYEEIESLSPERIVAAARRHGLRLGRRRMVVCGRLAPVKRVDLAIEAFARVAGERQDWDLVVLGGGPLMERLTASVPPELRDRVIFTGFVPAAADIAAILRNCEVLVHTADWEPWGLVLNEGAAAGLAIVASDVTGAAGDLVEQGVNGFLFASGDSDSLVRSLLSVTDAGVTAPLRAGSRGVLAEYRRRADAVDNLRAALRRFGVIS
jgi:glycosyltransferase involved in cell wall biosynthesis